MFFAKIKNDFYLALILLMLASCGFSIQAQKTDIQTNLVQNYDNIFCISKDYQICDYFKRKYSQSTTVQFDGIIEISVNDTTNFYSNWESSGAPKISKTIATINYTIVKNSQLSSSNRSIITGLVSSDNPYQFGSSVIGDLYIQKHSKENTVDNVINIIQHSIQSIE